MGSGLAPTFGAGAALEERSVRVMALDTSIRQDASVTAVNTSTWSDPAHPDAETLTRLLAGDGMAWRRLHAEHAGDVFRLARRFVHSDAEADEVTQEVFIAAHRSLERFRGQSRLRTWLYRITVNRALKRRRWWHRRRETGEDAIPLQFATTAGPEHRTIDRDQLRRLNACLEKLEVRKRTVLVLHEVEGLDTREIALVLDCPRSTVLTRLARARADLVEIARRAGLEIPTSPADAASEED